MRRTLSALALSVALGIGWFGVGAATPSYVLAAPTCSQMSITVYRDIYYAGSHVKLCYGIGGVASLGDLKGPCGLFGDWNDCVSSFTADVPSGWCLRLYRDASFAGLEYAFRGIVHVAYGVMTYGYNDTTSSIRFTPC
jgi:hypothetical protein